jgi:integrase
MDAAFTAAVKAKRLPAGRRKPVMHDCRHTFGSMLIAEGRNVVYVQREMGHSSPATTLNVYAAEFNKAENADPATRPNYGLLLAAVGNLVETSRSFSQPQARRRTA